MIRVTSIDPRLTRTVRSFAWAEERARRVALLAGSAEIQQRERGGDWQTVESYERVGSKVRRNREGAR